MEHFETEPGEQAAGPSRGRQHTPNLPVHKGGGARLFFPTNLAWSKEKVETAQGMVMVLKIF